MNFVKKLNFFLFNSDYTLTNFKHDVISKYENTLILEDIITSHAIEELLNDDIDIFHGNEQIMFMNYLSVI